MIDSFAHFHFLFVVWLLNDILLTGPIIVACQWNTAEAERNKNVTVKNFRKIYKDIIDSLDGINCYSVI